MLELKGFHSLKELRQILFIEVPFQVLLCPGDFNGWNPSPAPMTRLSQTNFFYYSRNFEMNARLDYKFVVNGSSWILDPENPNRVSGGFGPNSELAMPEYIQPWEIKYKPGINHGSVVYRTIFSNNTASNYQLQIYLPFGYDHFENISYSVFSRWW